MEVADVFVVNKADRPGADKLRQELEVMLGIRKGNAFRHVPAHHGVRRALPHDRASRRRTPGTIRSCSTSAAKGEGVAELVAALDRRFDWLERHGRADSAPSAEAPRPHA